MIDPKAPPVLFVRFKADGSRGPIVDHNIALLPGETRVMYVPVKTLCRGCRHWNTWPPGSNFCGIRLECLPEDGSGFCYHGIPKESES